MSQQEKKQPDPGIYSPKQAMVVYATRAADNIPSKYYIEISDILSDAGKAYIGAGKPVTRATLQTLMNVVAEGDMKTFYSVANTIPPNLLLFDLRAGRNIMAWYKPASRQTILIKDKGSITNWVPPLVFIVKDQTLAVAALSKSAKPNVNTRLHYAPFFNVYSSLKVCLGDAKAPMGGGEIQELINEWEKVFWLSEFTEHVTGAYTKTDLIAWWRKRRRGKFNPKKLKLSDHTLKSLCENL
jgi:PRTRC genetic system protein B